MIHVTRSKAESDWTQDFRLVKGFDLGREVDLEVAIHVVTLSLPPLPEPDVAHGIALY